MSLPFSADLVGDAPLAAALVLAELMAVRQQVSGGAEAMLRQWKAALRRDEFVPSAHNLAHYLALRKADLRSTQDQLCE